MATLADASLRLESADCGYGHKTVLRDVTLSVAKGEVTALLGPNGSGKSTLLKTLAGAIPPLTGRAFLNGTELSALPKREAAQALAYVPQTESPAFDFTAIEIVMMGRIAHSDGLFETPTDIAAAEDAMRLADCLSVAERPMSTLSGGEAQRVRIARALAQEAPILLLDEPTTHLDVRHQLDTGRLVKRFAIEGKAVAVAIHDLNWAAMHCSQAVLLCKSAISLKGSIQEVLMSPLIDDAFECEFVRTRTPDLRLLVSDSR